MIWWIGLCGLGAVLCSTVTSGLLHGAEARSTAAWVVPVAVVWGAMSLGAARLTSRIDAKDLPASWTLVLIVAVAAAVRMPLLGTPPLLSDDVYRYLWEGLAMNAGHNPFTEAPATIHGLDDALRNQVNHAELTSIYPPLALFWFRLLSVLGGTVGVAQLAAGIADLAIVATITSYSRRVGHGIWPGVLYALHPLPALESAAGAHVETPAVALTALACLAWVNRNPHLGIAAAVGGMAMKLLPALLLPALLRRTGIRGGGALFATILVTALLAVPVLSAGDGLTTSFTIYAENWSFNGLAFPVLDAMVGPSARLILAAVGVCVVFWTVARDMDPVRSWLWIGTAFVLLSPTVHPWYLLWAIVPGLLMGSWGWAAAAIPLIGAYAVLGTLDASGVWTEGAWLWAFTWPPALSALALEQIQRRRQPDSEDPPRHIQERTEPGKEAKPDIRER